MRVVTHVFQELLLLPFETRLSKHNQRTLEILLHGPHHEVDVLSSSLLTQCVKVQWLYSSVQWSADSKSPRVGKDYKDKPTIPYPSPAAHIHTSY